MSLLHNIALSQVRGVGTATALKLLECTNGSSKDLFALSTLELKQLGDNILKLLSEDAKEKALQLAEQEIEFIDKNAVQPIFLTDKKYPSRLKECAGAPLLLYTKGCTDLNALRCLSIVGTRQPTQQGIDTTKEMVSEIAKTFPNTLIISGLAFGIDITAHKAALHNQLPTAAVLGHGLQTIYPAAHRSVAERIVKENGVLISSYLSSSTILPKNFIERNSIVAGLADAVIVIESKIKGGALATAHIANSFGRDVMAVPGNIHETCSKGCNLLIKSNIAALTENVKDIGYALGWDIKPKTDTQQQLFFDLSEKEQNIVTLLQQKGKMNIDALSIEMQINTSQLLPIITQLEFRGLLLSHPGKFYSLKK